MRLLDQVSQTKTPFLVKVPEKPAPVRLFGALDIAPAVRNASVRYVCEAHVSELCGQTARDLLTLERCLDLLHIPAQSLWVEWDDKARGAVLNHRPDVICAAARRAGVVVQTDEGGRRGFLQTCWESNEEAGAVDVSPILVEFDLDNPSYVCVEAEDVVPIAAATSEAYRPLLQYARFRVSPDWLRYYQERCDASTLSRVLEELARSVLHDFFFLLSLALLLEAAGGPLTRREVGRDLINRKRLGTGRPALLDHVELVAFLGHEAGYGVEPAEDGWGRRRRLHVVRGHLVRRGSAVFWRRSHWRGDAALGLIASRTVTLRKAS